MRIQSDFMELSSEEVEDYCLENAQDKILIKLPLFINNEYVADKITDVISDLSKALGDDKIDVIVSSQPVLSHTRVDNSHYGKAKLCSALIDGLHHDIMPYTVVIICVPKTTKQALLEICQNRGVYDIVESSLK